MAQDRTRHVDNVDGPWFVDRACIDCDAVRQVAPSLIGRAGRQSVVVRQPVNDDEARLMELAALACPTRSLRRDPPARLPDDLYPLELADGIHYCGYNSPDSFGANAYLAVRPEGNLLIDSPRFVKPLVEAVERLGGLSDVLLTHRDDVADADRWAERFGAEVWIHADDRDAAPFATRIVEGTDPVEVREDLIIVPVPGHTEGSVMFLLEDRFLFTGDSLYWGRTRQDLGIHRRATWYSLDAQLDSLERLAHHHRFSYVLAGHGDRNETDADDMHERLVRLVERERARA